MNQEGKPSELVSQTAIRDLQVVFIDYSQSPGSSDACVPNPSEHVHASGPERGPGTTGPFSPRGDLVWVPRGEHRPLSCGDSGELFLHSAGSCLPISWSSSFLPCLSGWAVLNPRNLWGVPELSWSSWVVVKQWWGNPRGDLPSRAAGSAGSLGRAGRGLSAHMVARGVSDQLFYHLSHTAAPLWSLFFPSKQNLATPAAPDGDYKLLPQPGRAWGPVGVSLPHLSSKLSRRGTPQSETALTWTAVGPSTSLLEFFCAESHCEPATRWPLCKTGQISPGLVCKLVWIFPRSLPEVNPKFRQRRWLLPHLRRRMWYRIVFLCFEE